MRTWKIEGPPEIVEGIVMNVMTSCSLRPANRARKPPMAWMPSWELPAMRITASGILETLRSPPDDETAVVASLMKNSFRIQLFKSDQKRRDREAFIHGRCNLQVASHT